MPYGWLKSTEELAFQDTEQLIETPDLNFSHTLCTPLFIIEPPLCLHLPPSLRIQGANRAGLE